MVPRLNRLWLIIGWLRFSLQHWKNYLSPISTFLRCWWTTLKESTYCPSSIIVSFLLRKSTGPSFSWIHCQLNQNQWCRCRTIMRPTTSTNHFWWQRVNVDWMVLNSSELPLCKRLLNLHLMLIVLSCDYLLYALMWWLLYDILYVLCMYDSMYDIYGLFVVG